MNLEDTQFDNFLTLVRAEALKAHAKHAPYSCPHHGYGVLLEEVDELWDEVKRKSEHRDFEAMRGELVQVAAVAARFDVSIVVPRLIVKAVFTPLAKGK